MRTLEVRPTERSGDPAHGTATEVTAVATFESRLRALFDAQFNRLFRYLHRHTGDADTAADAAQEAFVRLHDRGELPDRPPAWLITVALNYLRNARVQQRRRAELLTVPRGTLVHSDPMPLPDELAETRDARVRVRRALDAMPERERSLLLLRAEGYSYRELAEIVGVHEPSVGTLLSRARSRFREAYGDRIHAP